MKRTILCHEPRGFSNEFSLFYCTTDTTYKAAEDFVENMNPLKESAYWLTKKQAQKRLAWARREHAWFRIMVPGDNPTADTNLYLLFKENDCV